MLPHAFQIGPISIHAITLAYLLGLALSFWLALRRAEDARVSRWLITKWALMATVSTFLGTKLYHVVFFWKEIHTGLFHFLLAGVSGSGISGGILVLFPVSYWYLRRHSDSVWRIFDVLTPPWALMVCFGRLGCLAAGCCFGKPASGGLWMIFPLESPAGSTFPAQALIPTQLYQAVNAFLIMLIAMLADRRKRFDGFTFCAGLFLYGLDRFIIDFYRYQYPSTLLTIFPGYRAPVTQIVALGLMICALLLGWRLNKRMSASPTMPMQASA